MLERKKSNVARYNFITKKGKIQENFLQECLSYLSCLCVVCVCVCASMAMCVVSKMEGGIPIYRVASLSP